MIERRIECSAFVGWVLLPVFLVVGCGGGNKKVSLPGPAGPTAVIFIATPPKSLAVNASASLSAAAIYQQGAGGSSLVSWSVACGSAGACGSFGPSADANGTTYKAPAAIPSGGTVTVTATSMVDRTKSASTSMTITPPIPIAISLFAPPPAAMLVGSTFLLSAGIVNDVTDNPQVSWTVTCGSTGGCGSLSLTKTANEQQTTYTAPETIPSGGTVTVTATSVTDPTKSASAAIALLPAASTLADGTYVFQIVGGTRDRPSFACGVFTAVKGQVTGGEQDAISFVADADNNLTAYPISTRITGGSYAPGYDGNLAVTLQVGAGGAETLRGALAAGGRGFVSGVNGAPSDTILEPQTARSALSGGFAVTLSGADQYASPAWMGGVVNIDGAGTISGGGSRLDVIGGQFAGQNPLGAGTVSAPDAMGRVLITLNPGSGSALPPVYLAGYEVDGQHLRLIETGNFNDNANFRGVLGGEAVGQQGMSPGSPAGGSYVLAAQGSDTHGGLALAGLLRFEAGGAVSGTMSWNDGSGAGTPAAVTGSWTVDATGRLAVTGLSDGAGFSTSLRGYLGGDGGLVLSNDGNAIYEGQMWRQASGALSGNYGMDVAVMKLPAGSPGPAVGSLTAAGSGGTVGLSGYADLGAGLANFAVTGTFMPGDSGIWPGTLTGLGGQPGSFALFPIDGTRAVLMGTDAADQVLGVVGK